MATPIPEGHCTTVLLVDDHPLMRQGLRTLLESAADFAVVGEAADGEEALDQVRALLPDIVVMDITMPNLNGIEATRRILAEVPGTRVVALSIHAEKRFVDDMLTAGAAAYVLKDSVPEELVRAIHAVLKGESFLSAPILASVVAGNHTSTDEPATAASEETAETALMSAEPVLQTKLHAPVLPLDLVPRRNLIERLEAERARPLTLVSAPAGYGKSLLTSSWLERCDWPGAWLSLDEDDSELRQFLVYFVAAVRSLFPQACEDSLELAMTSELPRVPHLAAVLSNELDALEQPFILVLDDYHRISVMSPVHDLLKQLLVRPPIPLHLAILSRRDPPLPLVTLRARGQVTEVRTEELRFSKPETRLLIENTLGFTATDELLAKLDDEMEGWVVGLQLMSLASHRSEDPGGLLMQLHGGIQQIQEFIAHEVIDRQPHGLRDWLLKSAILDRFCAQLCDAVCATGEDAETPPLEGGRFIELLHEKNLFVISMGTQGEWFRYHHLFQASLLRELTRRLAADEIAELHRRASDWFEQRGLIDEAIRHALKAGDTIRAAEIVERHRVGILDSDKWYILEKWLAQLPEAVVQQRVELLLARVWIHFLHFRFEAVPQILDQIKTLLGSDTGRDALRAEVSFMRGYITMFLGEGAASLREIEKALKQLPASFHEARAQSEIIFALSSQMIGRKEQALQGLDRLLGTYRLPDDLRKTRLLVTYVFIHLIAGDLGAAELSNRRLKQVADSGHYAYAVAWCDYLQGNIHLQRNELDAAVLFLGRSVSQRYIHHKRAALDSFAGLAYAYQVLGRSDDAKATLRLLREYVAALDDPQLWALADAVETRLAFMQGRPEPAVGWVRSNQPPAPEAMLWWLEIPSLIRCRALIAEGSPTSLAAAQARLREYAELNQTHHNPAQLIGILALQALAYELQGQVENALAGLEQALTLAQPGRWVWPFVELGPAMAELLERFADQTGRTEFLRHVLDQFQVIQAQPASAAARKTQSRAASVAWTREPLTKRELDILELVANRLQNKEIASRLFVSPETVKTHLKHLYQKLGVSNRRDAAAKAAEILRPTVTDTRPG